MKLICFSAIVSLFYLLFFNYFLSPAQTDATLLLANNYQHCWMLHVASVCIPCCMLLDVVACCCAKFETSETFQPTTPKISFVPWSQKRSATMLDPFPQSFQHCWGHARSLRMIYKYLWVVSFPRCTAGPNTVGTCIRLHTYANTHATTPNIVGSCCVRLHAALYYLLIDLFIKQIKSWVREGSQLSEQLTALDCYTKGYCFP